MFKHNTLFVIGAGASAEVDIPVGRGLAGTISGKMDIRFHHGFEPIGAGDHNLYSHLTHSFPQEAAKLQPAAMRIHAGLPLVASIDDFLDQHRDDPIVNLYGKAAIVQAIAEAERNSYLFFDRLNDQHTFDDVRLSPTWYIRFFNMLSRNISRTQIMTIFDRVSFIVFNYDRCIEFFITQALSRAYDIPERDASDIVERLDIFHPYGSIGLLKNVPFGATRVNNAVLSTGIKTYTEQIGAGDTVERLQKMVARAQHIVFLGFAYHDQNLALLKPPKQLPARAIFGTALGLSKSDVDVVGHQIDGWFEGHDSSRAFRGDLIHFENKLSCARLFDEYNRSLAG